MEHILPAWIGKLAYAVAAAGVIGAGATLVSSAQDIAVLQSESYHNAAAFEKRLDRIEGKIDVLVDKAHSHPTP